MARSERLVPIVLDGAEQLSRVQARLERCKTRAKREAMMTAARGDEHLEQCSPTATPARG